MKTNMTTEEYINMAKSEPEKLIELIAVKVREWKKEGRWWVNSKVDWQSFLHIRNDATGAKLQSGYYIMGVDSFNPLTDMNHAMGGVKAMKPEIFTLTNVASWSGLYAVAIHITSDGERFEVEHERPATAISIACLMAVEG